MNDHGAFAILMPSSNDTMLFRCTVNKRLGDYHDLYCDAAHFPICCFV
ncbi:hypothetical protein HMPREF3190_00102 [Umbribacter vaginalis]|nr:hypothetical protein HMPREF3190_00102 [Coriobacteriales bacterium DNF00809]